MFRRAILGLGHDGLDRHGGVLLVLPNQPEELGVFFDRPARGHPGRGDPVRLVDTPVQLVTRAAGPVAPPGQLAWESVVLRWFWLAGAWGGGGSGSHSPRSGPEDPVSFGRAAAAHQVAVWRSAARPLCSRFATESL